MGIDDKIDGVRTGQAPTAEINFPPGYPQKREYFQRIIVSLGGKRWRPDCSHEFSVSTGQDGQISAAGEFRDRTPTLRELDCLQAALEKLNFDPKQEQEILSMLESSRNKTTDLILEVLSGERPTRELGREQLIDIIEDTLSGILESKVKPPVMVGREYCKNFRVFTEALINGNSWSITPGHSGEKGISFSDNDKISPESVLPNNLVRFIERYLFESRKAQQEYMAGFADDPAWKAFRAEVEANEKMHRNDNIDFGSYLRMGY